MKKWLLCVFIFLSFNGIAWSQESGTDQPSTEEELDLGEMLENFTPAGDIGSHHHGMTNNDSSDNGLTDDDPALGSFLWFIQEVILGGIF